MSMNGNEQERTGGRAEGQAAIPMNDQGPSYSSSYNESTPGEIIEDRRQSLHEHEATSEQDTGRSEQSDSDDR